MTTRMARALDEGDHTMPGIDPVTQNRTRWLLLFLVSGSCAVMGLQCGGSNRGRTIIEPECTERLDLTGQWAGALVPSDSAHAPIPVAFSFADHDSALRATMTFDGYELPGTFPCSWTDSLRLFIPNDIEGGLRLAGGQDGCALRGKWWVVTVSREFPAGTWYVERE